MMTSRGGLLFGYPRKKLYITPEDAKRQKDSAPYKQN